METGRTKTPEVKADHKQELQAARENKVRHPTRKSRFSLKMVGFPDLISFRTLFFPDLIFISGHPRKLASRAGCGAGRADGSQKSQESVKTWCRTRFLKSHFQIVTLAGVLSMVFGHQVVKMCSGQRFWGSQGVGSRFPVDFRTLFYSGPYFFPDLIFISSHPRFWRRPAEAKFPDLIFFRTLFFSGPYFRERPVGVGGAPRR